MGPGGSLPRCESTLHTYLSNAYAEFFFFLILLYNCRFSILIRVLGKNITHDPTYDIRILILGKEINFLPFKMNLLFIFENTHMYIFLYMEYRVTVSE